MENGAGLLVDCLSDSMINVNYFFVILSGNLNSSTSNISQHITTDTIFHSLCKAVQQILTGVLNNSGQSLLNACTALKLCILNGMCHGDHLGRYSTHIFQTLEAL